jgi:hypothetical protein
MFGRGCSDAARSSHARRNETQFRKKLCSNRVCFWPCISGICMCHVPRAVARDPVLMFCYVGVLVGCLDAFCRGVLAALSLVNVSPASRCLFPVDVRMLLFDNCNRSWGLLCFLNQRYDRWFLACRTSTTLVRPVDHDSRQPRRANTDMQVSRPQLVCNMYT